jgi:DNA-binding NarL/FixJ family response regulator
MPRATSWKRSCSPPSRSNAARSTCSPRLRVGEQVELQRQPSARGNARGLSAGRCTRLIASTRAVVVVASSPATLACAACDRQLEIFTKLASGKNNHDIARELSLSTNTVANHIASILAKLHLENRVQAAVQAVRSGIS